ncbi:MAG: energy-coupling factor ABC transporter ATP-binding protein [Anaeroplasmataceae bacterium]|nr:energy-coupling factor ABC transporter ATP-binding protein [Anaeroplasmataceae bacterium]
MKAIELIGVSFSYHGFENNILKDVNFSVSYGEIALVSGFSGEGKSTLISIISGIIPNIITGNITGEILIDGKSIQGYTLSQTCHKVGIVLQNADSQIIHKIVEDEIAFGCENFAIPQDKIGIQIHRVCNIMRIDKTAQTRSLSGGQKQRLITASTLATGQKILILDEPLANLDTASAKELMNILRTLAKAGYAILVVEHRIDMVLPFVDMVWNICAGVVKKIENKQEYLLSQAVTINDNSNFHAKGKILFSVNHMGFTFKKKEILKDINFEIYEGERLLLLGENGCGKTTLLRLLARLYKPSYGNIKQFIHSKFGNHKKSKKWFKSVGIVYQNPNYQLFMPTVEQEIAFNAESKEYAEQMIHLFGLEDLRKRHPQSLSEGQKRRVSIAAVAAGNPKVLLLDEPTVGQDYKGLCELVKILNKLHEESGNTMITITHDMRCAEALCDRVLVLADGKIKKQGDKSLASQFFQE